MKKKLSIIVPIYNAEKYIENLLDSIISQINKHVELILINDGSTDNSLEICNRYKNNYENIIVKTIENSGSGQARNIGIEYSNGEYLFFPDSDDELCPNAINNIFELLKEKPDYLVFSYYQCYRSDINNKKIISVSNKELDGKKIKKNYINHLIPSSNSYLQGAPWNKVFKASIIKNNNIKYPSLKRHQDDVFIINYINYANKILTSSKPIYLYYMNKSFDESLKFPRNYFEIRKEVYKIFKANLENWGKNTSAIRYIQLTFILTLKRMFMLSYSKKWNMNKKERKIYFKEILDDKEIENILVDLHKNINIVLNDINGLSKIKKTYYKCFIKLLKNKNYTTLKLFSLFLYKTGNITFFGKFK